MVFEGIQAYYGKTTPDFSFWSREQSIDFDIKKEFNAKLPGKQAKTFFKTNQRPAPNPTYNNYKRQIQLPYENILQYEKFYNKIDLNNISEYNIHAGPPVRSVTNSQIDLSLKDLARDYMNRTPNMYNDLEPFRSALKKEPIIGPSNYLRGLLSEKDLTPSPAMGGGGAATVLIPVQHQYQYEGQHLRHPHQQDYEEAHD